jgi:hypothetical protein
MPEFDVLVKNPMTLAGTRKPQCHGDLGVEHSRSGEVNMVRWKQGRQNLLVAFTIAVVLLTCSAAIAGKTMSGVTSLTINPASPQDLNSPAGHPYRRVFGTITGLVSADENVVGLTGAVTYTAQFEIFFPADAVSSLLLMEVENRGSPLAPGFFDDLPLASGPPATVNWSAYISRPYGGVGFFLDGRRSWARVQWQTGIAGGVPADAEGIGLVIIRDFGRMMAGENSAALLSQIGAGPYRDRILYGDSQSAWFVDTFIAEGFNEDPLKLGHGVYQVAITEDGAGSWLAINRLAGGATETPYVLPNGAPLTPEQLLRRPASDPFLVDVAAYTDFYRIRAGLTDQNRIPNQMRRYDWPAAHAPAVLLPPTLVNFVVFGLLHCDNSIPLPLNPLDSRPYLRALLAAIEQELVARDSESEKFHARFLPPSTIFELGPVPSGALTFNGLQAFNPLPGIDVPVPLVDSDAQPVGGVRYPESDHPLGRPLPVAIPHVGTDNINDTCGDFGGYEPFTKSELNARYGSEAAYIAAYGASLDELIARGFVLPFDRAGLLSQAADNFKNAP